VAGEVQQLVELMSTLRRRCPWDAEQTHASLRAHLLEETYEVLEAIDGVDGQTGEGYEHLEEELGDLLFQIVFHAALAAEAGQFTLADVARTVHDKLRGRHPHVFGDVVIATSGELAEVWEAAKLGEKGRSSVFDGVPPALPALAEALKVLKKGVAIPGGPPLPELAAAVATLTAVVGGGRVDTDATGRREQPGALPASVADVLLATVAAARTFGVDPESALRARTRSWRDAARVAETAAAVAGGRYGPDGSGGPAPGASGGGAEPGGGNAPGGANGPE
jgi:MazG family protein